MEKISKTRLISLMKIVGINPNLLSGANRTKHSTRFLSTMRTLADPVEYFRKAMSIELEHGSVNPSTDVTHDDLRQTAKIVAAHIFGVEHGERPGKWLFYPSYYDELIALESRAPKISTRALSRKIL
jgi:hypothetical protein